MRQAAPPPGDLSEITLHASCVAFRGRALLLQGESGSGKSAVALQLMACGADLIADDRTCLSRAGDSLIASAPPTLPPLIEARGFGLLSVTLHPAAPLCAVVALDAHPSARLPEPMTCDILGLSLPLFAGAIGPHLGAALLQYLKAGLAPTP